MCGCYIIFLDSENMTDLKVQEWLSSYSSASTKQSYSSSFKRFCEFCGKSGTQMIDEARRLWQNPETADAYALKVFQYQQALLNEKAKLTGSVKGRAGGTTGKLKNKNISQLTAKYATAVVQSFFAFHNVPLNMKKFKKKDARTQRPKVERKKHLFTLPELQKLFQVANLRDKCVIALGLAGQDESTIASLGTDLFNGKLGGITLELVELTRPRTNTDILMVLTPETQNLLKAYIQTIKAGWLFPGYNSKHFENGQPNKILKALCEKTGITDNGRRVSFHCLRLWFSQRLRNKISDDLIDLFTGHVPRFGGAYVSDDPEPLKKQIIEAGIIDLLKIEQTAVPTTEIEMLKEQISELASMMFVLADGKKDIKDKVLQYLSDGDKARLIKAAEEKDEV
jgi:integrase